MTGISSIRREHEAGCGTTAQRPNEANPPGVPLQLTGVRAAPQVNEAGFTLIETLVAFAVLALALGVLLGGLSRMTTGGRHVETLREALELAQARIDGLGVVESLTPGESAGRFENDFVWHLHVGDLRNSANATGMAGAWVEITVSAGAGATLTPSAVSLVGFKLVASPRT